MTLKNLPVLGVLLTSFSFTGSSLIFTNFQSASLVIGQSNFTEIALERSAEVMDAAATVALSPLGHFALGSSLSGRICLWNQIPHKNGIPADIVLGKSDFSSKENGTTASLFQEEILGVTFTPDGKKLLVSDSSNHRVLIWNSIPTNNFQPADVIIGQESFTAGVPGISRNQFQLPAGLLVTPEGKLLIADSQNHRVLVYNNVPETNRAAADVVIGQPDFNTGISGNAANQMNQPFSLALSPEGKLVVGERAGNRALIFNQIPTTNGVSADVVIGQEGFGINESIISQKHFGQLRGLAISKAGQLAVSDENSRVLIYETLPQINGAFANIVLGQANFLSSGYNEINASTLGRPLGLTYDSEGKLFVADEELNRILVFEGSQKNIPLNSGDFNGDGQLDFILQTKTATGSEIQLILMTNENEILEALNLIQFSDKKTKVVGAGYYNGDSFLDILLQNGSRISFLAMSNTVVKTTVSLGTLKAKPGKVRASGDFDLDGVSDMLVQKGAKLQLLRGVDLAPLTPYNKLKAGYKIVGVGDADADGLIDFLLQKGKNLSIAFFIEADSFVEEEPLEDDFSLEELEDIKAVEQDLRIEIIPLQRLDRSLGKVVAVKDSVGGGVDLVFQQKEKACLLKMNGEILALPLSNLGANTKIVGPR